MLLTSATRLVSTIVVFVVLLTGAPVAAVDQRLPLRRYGIDDGLAHNVVGAIFQDSKGYLWFGTAEGLSRFDGYSFTNYGRNEGL